MPCRLKTPGRLIGQPVVIRSGRPAQSEISQAAALPVRWKIVTALKVIAEGEASGRVVVWPQDLPLGVYRLQLIDAASTTEDVPLLVAPRKRLWR